MEDEQVFVDTTRAEFLSFSFLDELIFWLAGSRNMGKAVFIIDNTVIEDKLSRIAAIRGVDVHYKTATSSEIALLSPTVRSNVNSRFVPVKTALK